jgi:hypothetical protein
MCNPLAIGSKQASLTIWARCRGGKTLRSARALCLVEHAGESLLFVAATQPPDGHLVTLHLDGNRLDALPGPNRQENPGMLNLEPRLRATSGDIFQYPYVGFGDVERPGSSTTHGSLQLTKGVVPA